ncbi:Aspartate--tRNA(Asp/Asn) ligase [Candidatus Lokiarchaeum ossiferum]|uniref:Aspartate--tRNA(Asp/Asn) ligase n=1 Tax=Candidatus Lokiarchaeum ossiferum TaxID=2951803 RepID=A0ABY6HXL3_9ARCH|nr:Aspartate--tRNA(Asp/Asn) ligase [Candidatus Lokiarchaeum sp. B-35]
MSENSLEALGEMRKTHFSKDLSPDLVGQEVIIGGWVTRTRKLGGLVFIVLQDKFSTVQVTAKKGVVSDEIFEKAKSVGNQWCLLIKGEVKAFKNGPHGVELVPLEICILNQAIEQLPLDMTGKAMSDLDTRLNNRSLDLRHPRNQAIFRIQSVMLNEIRKYLVKNNYTEIMTPKIIGSATEGGTELFPIKYFDKDAYLSQSAQLYKERLCSVYENVFEIAPCYRAEKSFTNRHLCEIYQLDMELAFADYKDVLVAMEGLVQSVLQAIKVQCEEDLKILDQWENFEVPQIPFPRYTYSEVLKIIDEKCGIKIEFGEDISTEAYRKLDEILPGYYFITKWPMSVKPFYIHFDPENPELSDGFDLQKGWLELSSGGTRVHEKELLIKNLEKQGLNPDAFKSHLQAFDYGMPPHAGMGFGIARWLQIITGVDQIKECVFYPRTPDRLDP